MPFSRVGHLDLPPATRLQARLRTCLAQPGLFGLVALLHPLATAAQEASPALQRALTLDQRTAGRVLHEELQPAWLPDSSHLWYRTRQGESSHWVLIETATGKRRTAPALEALELDKRLGASGEIRTASRPLTRPPRQEKSGLETTLHFVNQTTSPVELRWLKANDASVSYGRIEPGQKRSQPTFAGHAWELRSVADHEPLAFITAEPWPQRVLIDGPAKRRPTPPRGTLSPDGLWRAWVEQGSVRLVSVKAPNTSDPQGQTPPAVTEWRLQSPLGAGFPLQGKVVWAPHSRAFAVSAAAPVTTRQITIVESSPQGQVQPKLRTLPYAKPGDELPQPWPVIFRHASLEAPSQASEDQTKGHPANKSSAEEWRALPVRSTLLENVFATQPEISHPRWSPDAKELYFDHNHRGHQSYRILAANAQTGDVRVVAEETSPTFIHYARLEWRHWLANDKELLWLSERSGWWHLWLLDAHSGAVRKQVTHGDWPVREVLHVDEELREVWFMASGLRSGEDPYHLHLCRVSLDTGTVTRLTEGEGNHHIEFSPTREYFTDTWSRVDHPPVHELRRSRDGSLVCVLEKADAQALLATGWSLPERITAKGRDGKTDIYGLLIKPHNFDPSRKYPVLEEVYAGPHSAHVPKDFGRLLRMQQLASLGYVIVRSDGMGTTHRGKAFHDVCWKNLKDAGFPDRKAWLKEAARTRPWMDLTRVGIYGGSAGGQNAMRALLDHADLYRAAVADCGCHDNRMDKIWWNEQWMGWPVDDSYARSSNVVDAPHLQGHLLLLVGEVDTNVDPASTYQVVGALQRAGKSFEFMPIIGAGHGSAETPFGTRLRMEFFLRHLHP